MNRNGLNCVRPLWAATVLVSAVACGTPNIAPDGSAPSAVTPSVVPFVWRHEHARFAYVGFTVRYSCDGLEAQVRRVLMYLGARKDAKVNATGCPLASTAPGRNAWVDAEFDVPEPLPPTDAGAVAAAGGSAHWRDVRLTPRQPGFLADGDCELIEGMKDLFTKTLHLRGLEYRASCFPGSLSPDGFEVSGQALKVIDPKDGDARR
jgi:hypothetical protein